MNGGGDASEMGERSTEKTMREEEKQEGRERGRGEGRREGTNSIPPPSDWPHKAVGSLTRRKKNFYILEKKESFSLLIEAANSCIIGCLMDPDRPILKNRSGSHYVRYFFYVRSWVHISCTRGSKHDYYMLVGHEPCSCCTTHMIFFHREIYVWEQALEIAKEFQLKLV